METQQVMTPLHADNTGHTELPSPQLIRCVCGEFNHSAPVPGKTASLWGISRGHWDRLGSLHDLTQPCLDDLLEPQCCRDSQATVFIDTLINLGAEKKK